MPRTRAGVAGGHGFAYDGPCGPEDADVKESMSGNLCCCGAYPNIVTAI